MVQPEKVFGPILVTPSEIVAESKEEQPSNAPVPSMNKKSQSSYKYPPILVTFDGISIVVS